MAKKPSSATETPAAEYRVLARKYRPQNFSELKGDPKYRFISWDCDAGDVICHHPLTVHGAGANPLTSRRAAISVRYAGKDARWDPRPNVMKVDGDPESKLKAGDPLILDDVFPITWERQRAHA